MTDTRLGSLDKHLKEYAVAEGLIISICMYCSRFLREVPAGKAEGGISHSICDGCLEEFPPSE